MKVERLVIDSNVWNAALISPAGAARQLVDAVLDRNIDILMSEAMFTELVSRMERPKSDRYRDPELALWLEDSGIATGICRDAGDDKFLALAVTGQPDAIVSGDKDLLELVSHEGIPILTPPQFLQRLGESGQ